MSDFTGTGVAVITPFTKENTIDYPALSKIINHLINRGIDYLVVMGSTAEAATLNKDEKDSLRAFFVKETQGRVPLVLGIGGNNTARVVAEIKATDVTGYQAILSVSPSYNKPSQEGIYRHFKAVAEASPLPIILYNVPGRTGINMMPETVIRLAQDFDSIIGIKEAAGDIVQALSLIQKKPDNFLIISGDDMIALPMTLAGGAGVISVIAQGLPSDFSSMIRLGLKGEASKAYTIQYRLMDSIDLIFEEGNPTGIKELLRQQNYCSNKVRLPLVEATKTLQNRIQLFLKEYH